MQRQQQRGADRLAGVAALRAAGVPWRAAAGCANDDGSGVALIAIGAETDTAMGVAASSLEANGVAGPRALIGVLGPGAPGTTRGFLGVFVNMVATTRLSLQQQWLFVRQGQRGSRGRIRDLIQATAQQILLRQDIVCMLAWGSCMSSYTRLL